MARALLVLASFASFVCFACGGLPPMPKGPPPEYEEHDAGTPVFEGAPPPAQTEPVKR